MTGNNSIVGQLGKTTENYAVYESPEVGGSQALTGAYVHLSAFGGEPPEYLSFTVGDDGNVTLEKDKDTKNYGVYESSGGAIGGMYVSHDHLDSPEGDEGREAPDETALTLSPATEDDYEEEAESEELQDEADNLLAGAGDEDSVEVSTEDEADDLLDEAENAAE